MFIQLNLFLLKQVNLDTDLTPFTKISTLAWNFKTLEIKRKSWRIETKLPTEERKSEWYRAFY